VRVEKKSFCGLILKDNKQKIKTKTIDQRKRQWSKPMNKDKRKGQKTKTKDN
jgi:hypothetical protein